MNEQNEIIAMARYAGIEESNEYDHLVCTEVELLAFAKLVAEREREACAKVCEKHADVYGAFEQTPEIQSAWAACIDSRDAIRARGEA